MDNGHNIVAGACYDLINHLSSLEDPITIGKQFQATDLLDELANWAIINNLKIEEPLIRGWRLAIDHISPAQKSVNELEQFINNNFNDQATKNEKENSVDTVIRILNNLLDNLKQSDKRTKKVDPKSEEGIYNTGYNNALTQLKTY